MREICLSAVHRTPLANIRIERAVAAPLSAVKTWVLKGNPEIKWATWSENLTNLPMDERVAVCVYSKIDGSLFTAPPGLNTPEPSQSLVGVVTRNGDSTLYMMGDTSDMLSATPETFVSWRPASRHSATMRPDGWSTRSAAMTASAHAELRSSRQPCDGIRA